MPDGEHCDVCGEPLTDRDGDGAYRADCPSLRTQWCGEWTEAREQRLMSQDARPRMVCWTGHYWRENDRG